MNTVPIKLTLSNNRATPIQLTIPQGPTGDQGNIGPTGAAGSNFQIYARVNTITDINDVSNSNLLSVIYKNKYVITASGELFENLGANNGNTGYNNTFASRGLFPNNIYLVNDLTDLSGTGVTTFYDASNNILGVITSNDTMRLTTGTHTLWSANANSNILFKNDSNPSNYANISYNSSAKRLAFNTNSDTNSTHLFIDQSGNTNIPTGQLNTKTLYIDGQLAPSNIYSKSRIDASFADTYVRSRIDASFADTYTRNRIDASFNDTYTRNRIDASFNDTYVRSRIDASFADTYVRSRIDASFADTYVRSRIDASFVDTYNRSRIDASFSDTYNKATTNATFLAITDYNTSAANYYTKTETQALSNLTNYYTKTRTDASFATLAKTDTSFNDLYFKINNIDYSALTSNLVVTGANITLSGVVEPTTPSILTIRGTSAIDLSNAQPPSTIANRIYRNSSGQLSYSGNKIILNTDADALLFSNIYHTKTDASNVYTKITTFNSTISDVSNTKLNLAGGQLTGTLDMGNNKITSTYVPTNSSDLTNKQYTDATFATKTYVEDVSGSFYRKSYIDTQLNNVYTKTQSDGNYYLKSYVDASFGGVYATFSALPLTDLVVPISTLNNSITLKGTSTIDFGTSGITSGTTNKLYRIPGENVLAYNGERLVTESNTTILSDFYNRSRIDASFALITKVDASINNVYTKANIDASYNYVNTRLLTHDTSFASINTHLTRTDNSINNIPTYLLAEDYYDKEHVDISINNIYTTFQSYINTALTTSVSARFDQVDLSLVQVIGTATTNKTNIDTSFNNIYKYAAYNSSTGGFAIKPKDTAISDDTGYKTVIDARAQKTDSATTPAVYIRGAHSTAGMTRVNIQSPDDTHYMTMGVKNFATPSTAGWGADGAYNTAYIASKYGLYTSTASGDWVANVGKNENTINMTIADAAIATIGYKVTDTDASASLVLKNAITGGSSTTTRANIVSPAGTNTLTLAAPNYATSANAVIKSTAGGLKLSATTGDILLEYGTTTGNAFKVRKAGTTSDYLTISDTAINVYKTLTMADNCVIDFNYTTTPSGTSATTNQMYYDPTKYAFSSTGNVYGTFIFNSTLTVKPPTDVFSRDSNDKTLNLISLNGVDTTTTEERNYRLTMDTLRDTTNPNIYLQFSNYDLSNSTLLSKSNCLSLFMAPPSDVSVQAPTERITVYPAGDIRIAQQIYVKEKLRVDKDISANAIQLAYTAYGANNKQAISLGAGNNRVYLGTNDDGYLWISRPSTSDSGVYLYSGGTDAINRVEASYSSNILKIGNIGGSSNHSATHLYVNGSAKYVCAPTASTFYNTSLNVSNSTGISGVMSLYDSGITSSTPMYFLMGKNIGDGNAASLKYHYISDGNSANYLTLGFTYNDTTFKLNYGSTAATSIATINAVTNINGDVTIKDSTASTTYYSLGSSSATINTATTLTNTLAITATSTAPITILNSAMSMSTSRDITWGKASANANSGLLRYYYSGDGSSANYVGLGLYGNASILSATYGGNVGIGTTAPGYKLDVAGTANAQVARTGVHSSVRLITGSTNYGSGQYGDFMGVGNTNVGGLPSSIDDIATGFKMRYDVSGNFVFYKGSSVIGEDRVLLSAFRDSDRMGIRNSSPSSVLTVGPYAGTGLTGISTWGGWGSTDIAKTLIISHSDENSVSSGAPKPLLTLIRGGTNSVSYASGATFDIGRYASSGNNSYTRMDVSLMKTSCSERATVMTMLDNGNVGIGNSAPAYALDVAGDVYSSGRAIVSSALSIGTTSAPASTSFVECLGDTRNRIIFGKTLSAGNSAVLKYNFVTDNSMSNSVSLGMFGQESANSLFVTNDGKIGVCVSNPTARLEFGYGDHEIGMRYVPGGYDYRNGIYLNGSGRTTDIYSCSAAQPNPTNPYEGCIRFKTRGSSASGSGDYGTINMVLDPSGDLSMNGNLYVIGKTNRVHSNTFSGGSKTYSITGLDLLTHGGTYKIIIDCAIATDNQNFGFHMTLNNDYNMSYYTTRQQVSSGQTFYTDGANANIATFPSNSHMYAEITLKVISNSRRIAKGTIIFTPKYGANYTNSGDYNSSTIQKWEFQMMILSGGGDGNVSTITFYADDPYWWTTAGGTIEIYKL